MIALTAMAPVKKVAFATGEIQAAEEIVVVEHSVGGDVAAVFATADGDIAEGAPILKLDERALLAEIESLEIRRAHLGLRAARLSSLLDDRDFAPRTDPHLTSLDVMNASRLYDAEKADFANEIATLKARIAERDADRKASLSARRGVLAELAAYREQAALSADLQQRGLGTRRAVLDATARAAGAETRLAELDGRIAAADVRIDQLDAEIRRAAALRGADWSTSLTEAAEELARTEAALTAAYDRRDSLLVVAPISGRVLELGSEAPGDVIAAGELIARIVPNAGGGASDLVAEVRISPDDIGHIEPGAQAIVEVTTFNRDLFGEISGSLISISPSSVADEQGAPMFRARLALDRIEAEIGEATLRLAPGMVVSARIVTAERSLFDYLAEPISRALTVAFSD